MDRRSLLLAEIGLPGVSSRKKNEAKSKIGTPLRVSFYGTLNQTNLGSGLSRECWRAKGRTESKFAGCPIITQSAAPAPIAAQRAALLPNTLRAQRAKNSTRSNFQEGQVSDHFRSYVSTDLPMISMTECLKCRTWSWSSKRMASPFSPETAMNP